MERDGSNSHSLNRIIDTVEIRAVDTDSDAYQDWRAILSTDFERPFYWGEIEILEHEQGSVDLSVVDRGQAAVGGLGHRNENVCGSILADGANIGNGKFEATLRIVNDGGRGSEINKLWAQGIGTSLSIDYRWGRNEGDVELEKRLADDNDDVIYVYRVKRWQILGVSVVRFPADDEATVQGARTYVKNYVLQRGLEMQILGRDSGSGVPENDIDENQNVDISQAPRNSADDVNEYDLMRNSINTDFDEIIASMNEDKLSNGMRDHLTNMRMDHEQRIRRGGEYVSGTLTRDALKLLAENGEAGISVSEDITVTDDGETVRQDLSKNALVRAFADASQHLGRSTADATSGMIDIGLGQNHTSNAGHVRELNMAMLDACSSEVRTHLQGTNGVMMTPDVYINALRAMERSFTVTGDTGTKGANLVQTDVLTTEWVDQLYASAELDFLGVRMMMGQTSNLQIPQLGGKLSTAYVAETGEITAADTTITAVTTTPHRMGSRANISQQLLFQTNEFASEIVMAALMAGKAEQVNTTALNGSGASNQPTGLTNVTGLGNKDVVWASASWEDVLDWITKLSGANASMSGARFVLGNAGLAQLAATFKDANGGSEPIVNFMRNPDGRISLSLSSGIPGIVTTILTAGSETVVAIIGNWKMFWYVEYGMPFVIQDSITRAAHGEKVTTLQCFNDFKVLRTADFATLTTDTIT